MYMLNIQYICDRWKLWFWIQTLFFSLLQWNWYLRRWFLSWSVCNGLAVFRIDFASAGTEVLHTQVTWIAPRTDRKAYDLFAHDLVFESMMHHEGGRTCPKPTIIWLMSPYNSLGSQDCKFSLPSTGAVNKNDRTRTWTRCTYRVCSGVLVGGLCHPRRFVILWTWTSTPIPSFLNPRSINLLQVKHIDNEILHIPCYLEGQKGHLGSHPRERTKVINIVRHVRIKVISQFDCSLLQITAKVVENDDWQKPRLERTLSSYSKIPPSLWLGI